MVRSGLIGIADFREMRPQGAVHAAPHAAPLHRALLHLREELRRQEDVVQLARRGAIAVGAGPAVAGEAEYAAAQKTKAGETPAGPGAGGAPLEKALGLVEWLLSPASDGISGRLIAAPWDPWSRLGERAAELASSDVYTLRRIVPEDRGMKWPG